MKSNIIICEDHPIVLQSLSKIITTNFIEYAVIKCSTKNELFNQLKNNTIDFAILDLNVNSENLVNSFAEIETLQPQLKILIFSNYADLAINQRVKHKQIRAALSKNANEKEIILALTEVMNNRFYFDEGIQAETNKESFKKIQNLTEREKQIIACITNGETNQLISESLFISIETVKTHRKNIYKKLNLKGVNQLVTFALNNNITNTEFRKNEL